MQRLNNWQHPLEWIGKAHVMQCVMPVAITLKPTDQNNFIIQLGLRVREDRSSLGFSRRQLAEYSGVSQRHLAQLERGEGNISIMLLRKVAIALHTTIENLLTTPCNDSSVPVLSDAVDRRFTELFSHAPQPRRQQVMEILEPGGAQRLRARRVALIGLRGAGKSTLGKLASEELQAPFTELNDEIERVTGMSINETMALYGQEGYRSLERQALERVTADSEYLVLAVAGGIVSDQQTYDFLLSHYHTIWLKAAPEEHMSRVLAQGDERPMAGNPEAFDQLRSILASREPLYAKAADVVDTSGISRDQSLWALIASIGRLGCFSTGS